MTNKQLFKFVKDFRAGILGRRSSKFMCFAVCAPLQSLLENIGYKTELVEGVVARKEYGITCYLNHFWLKLDNGQIIDPTADQFSTETNPMPAVYIGIKPEIYQIPQKLGALLDKA